jgi:hypothetical protein
MKQEKFMPVIKLETVVKGILAEVEVRLEGFKIDMAHDGEGTRKSTNYIEVNDGYMNVYFRAVGPLANQGWEIIINQLDPPVANNPNANKNPIYNKSGSTPSTGRSMVFGGTKI